MTVGVPEVGVRERAVTRTLKRSGEEMRLRMVEVWAVKRRAW